MTNANDIWKKFHAFALLNLKHFPKDFIYPNLDTYDEQKKYQFTCTALGLLMDHEKNQELNRLLAEWKKIFERESNR